MARLDRLPEPLRAHLVALDCPSFTGRPWAVGPVLGRRRVAIVSSAGLYVKGDRSFLGAAGEFREIPGSCRSGDLVMGHISRSFDRTGFQQDWNVVFPLERLGELAAEGFIGSVADRHYSFMGATHPAEMEVHARRLAGVLKADGVDAALLVPV